jgi:hypothetical protein
VLSGRGRKSLSRATITCAICSTTAVFPYSRPPQLW